MSKTKETAARRPADCVKGHVEPSGTEKKKPAELQAPSFAKKKESKEEPSHILRPLDAGTSRERAPKKG